MKPPYLICRHNKFVLLLIISMSFLLAACRPGKDVAEAAALPVVAVAVIAAEQHPIQTILPGRIVATRTAEVRARVTGIVQKRLFTEGSDVTAGQVLFQIDPAALRATLAKARGALAGAEAVLTAAREVVERYRPLVEQDAISRMVFSNALADQEKAVAERQAARAAVTSAQLDLDHATVRAPIAGRIGYALVSEGGLVSQTEATPLALIQSIDSVYVDLMQPASSPTTAAQAANTANAASASKSVKPAIMVSIDINEDRGPAIQGALQFEDISVDPGTGQVRSRAVLPNPDHRLLPGMFVRATVVTGTNDQALFIPQTALRFAADGVATVQEVDSDHVLRIRKVVLGDMQGARWQVRCGINPGAHIVTDYADDVPDGTKVTPEITAEKRA